MKLYAWSEVATGAYHADGVAVVLANSEEEARALLAAADEQPDANGFLPHYHYADGLDEVDNDTELRVVELTEPTVVLTYQGCDC